MQKPQGPQWQKVIRHFTKNNLTRIEEVLKTFLHDILGEMEEELVKK